MINDFAIFFQNDRYVIRRRILFHHGHDDFSNLELLSDTRYII